MCLDIANVFEGVGEEGGCWRDALEQRGGVEIHGILAVYRSVELPNEVIDIGQGILDEHCQAVLERVVVLLVGAVGSLRLEPLGFGVVL